MSVDFPTNWSWDLWGDPPSMDFIAGRCTYEYIWCNADNPIMISGILYWLYHVVSQFIGDEKHGVFCPPFQEDFLRETIGVPRCTWGTVDSADIDATGNWGTSRIYKFLGMGQSMSTSSSPTKIDECVDTKSEYWLFVSWTHMDLMGNGVFFWALWWDVLLYIFFMSSPNLQAFWHVYHTYAVIVHISYIYNTYIYLRRHLLQETILM